MGGRATICADDPSVIQAEIDAWKAKLMKAADLQMFGQKRKEPEKPKEEEKKLARKATKITKSSARGDSMTRGAQSDRHSMGNLETEECDDKMSIPKFDIEIVKTTRVISPDKKNRKKEVMQSMKTVVIQDDKSEAEAKAIYGGVAGGVKVATKDELKQSVGIAKPEPKKINLFKRKKSPKGPFPAAVDERLILQPVLQETKRKAINKQKRDRQNDARSRDNSKKMSAYDEAQRTIGARVSRQLLDDSYQDFDIDEGVNVACTQMMPQSLSPVMSSRRHHGLNYDDGDEPLQIYKPSETCPDTNNNDDNDNDGINIGRRQSNQSAALRS